MEQALLFSILTLIVFGIYDFLIVKPARQLPLIVLGLLISGGQAIIFGLLFLIFQESISFSYAVIYPFLVGLFGLSGVLMYAKSLQGGLTGISASIGNAYPIITILIGAFIFGEKITLYQYLFFILILIGIFILSIKYSEIKNLKKYRGNQSVIYAIGAMIMWAGCFAFFDLSLNYYSPITTIFLSESGNILSLILLLYFYKQEFVKVVKNIHPGMFLHLGYILLFSVLGMFLFAKAFETGNLSFVSSITASSPVITTLLARIILKEQLSITQYSGIFIVVTGVCGLSYVSVGFL